MPSIKTPWLILAVALLLGGCGTLSQKSSQTAAANVDKAIDAGAQKAYADAVQSLRRGETAQAKQQFEKLASQYPNLAGPYTNLGIIQLKANDPAAAEQFFRQSLERNPESAQAQNQLGVSLRMQGRFQDAEQAYLSCKKGLKIMMF